MSSCPVHEAYAWMEEVTSLNSCAYDASSRREFEKACFTSFAIIPIQSYTWEVCYGLTGSLPPFHVHLLVHQATD